MKFQCEWCATLKTQEEVLLSYASSVVVFILEISGGIFHCLTCENAAFVSYVCFDMNIRVFLQASITSYTLNNKRNFFVANV